MRLVSLANTCISISPSPWLGALAGMRGDRAEPAGVSVSVPLGSGAAPWQVSVNRDTI